MHLEVLNLPSFWKITLKQKYIQIQENNSKLVVLFPGKNYSCEMPCLYYAGSIAIQCGFDLLVLEYGYQVSRVNLDIDDLSKVIDESQSTINLIISKYQEVVFISKSLGTIVAGEVSNRLGIPVRNIYLTPIKDSIPYINSTGGLVIYGTKDDLFNNELATQFQISRTKVIEIPGADHSLEKDDVQESLLVLKSLVDIYMNFLKANGFDII